ncbi:MAG: hypothetical protein SangKO_083550 [Sandaracinaceae bacterium]|nr:hypothetical protein [Myxococcales bacterium]
MWLSLCALLWTAFQLVPLPREIIALLQPRAIEAADDATRLLDSASRSWLPLSLSPHGTLWALVRGGAVVCAFSAAWLLAAARERRRVLMSVAASVIAIAVVALAHLGAGAERVFGIYRQVETASSLLAPVLNQNHLSGFLAMGTPLVLGFGLEAEERGARIAWLTAAAVTGAASLIAVSRGGVASLVCGLLALGLLGLMRRKGSTAGERVTPLLLILATSVSALGLGLYVAFEGLKLDFEAGDLSKLELAGEGIGLAVDHPWVGVGRGAFSAAFVADHGARVRYTHPENWIAQWTSEWGLVLSVALIVALLIAVARAVKAAKSWPRLGALAALVSIGTHDLVDFATETAGIAVVVGALAGAALYPSREGTTSRRFHHASLGAALSVALVVAFFGWRLDRTSVSTLRHRLENALLARDHEGFQDTLSTAVALHPSEPAFFLLGGAEAGQRGDRRSIAWLNHAMRLAAEWPAPHLEAARYLALTGRYSQAFTELREVELRGPGAGAPLACEVLSRSPESVPDLIRAARADEVGLRLLDGVARCLPLDDETAIEIDRHLSTHGVPTANLRRARRSIAAGAHQEALSALPEVSDDPDVLTIRARALMESGEPAQAAILLERAVTGRERPQGILRLLARAYAQAGDAERMRATVSRLRGTAAGRAPGVAGAWVLQGNLERGLGNDGAAMQAFERANRIDPTSAGLHHVARLSEHLGDLGRAYRAHSSLCRSGEAAACAHRDRIRRRLAEPRTLDAQP